MNDVKDSSSVRSTKSKKKFSLFCTITNKTIKTHRDVSRTFKTFELNRNGNNIMKNGKKK